MLRKFVKDVSVLKIKSIVTNKSYDDVKLKHSVHAEVNRLNESVVD